MDTILEIERIGLGKLNLYSCETIRVKQIRTDPTTSFLREIAHQMESLHGLINEIQQQHSPELRRFAINEVNLTGYTDEHNILQAIITLKKR